MADQEQISPYSHLVEGQSVHFFPSFTLDSGVTLRQVPVGYKTWGKLNNDGSNCMVLCHALSGSSDASEWWGPLFGQGRPFDTAKFFIFCGNVLGSPYGSASPCTNNPETGNAYGPEFPQTTIRDDVRIHAQLLAILGVKEVIFAIGGSMGGMQVLEWGYIPFVKHIVPIATSGRHSAWCISWGEAQRQSIYSDPNYKGGHYDKANPPYSGLSAARMAALLTYRSRNSFESRFGRKRMTKTTLISGGHSLAELEHNEGQTIMTHASIDAVPTKVGNIEARRQSTEIFSAQSYLRYQGDKFKHRFDANCYISITRKLDSHDVSRGRGTYEEALGQLTQPCLVIGILVITIGVETDGLFTVEEQYELGELIPNAQVELIQSGDGHDGFLLEFDQMKVLLRGFIEKHAPEFFVTEDAFQPDCDIEVKKNSTFGEQEDILMW